MSHVIELPDPLFAQINGYAQRVASSPLNVLNQAWEEFRERHAQQPGLPHSPKLGKSELLALIESLPGSLTLPPDADYESLRYEALAEKYGPL